MGIKTITRRFAAWIACCAILFAALAPSISHAVSASRGTIWTEICSASGAKFVQASADPRIAADPEQQDSTHFKHCPFCATHAGSFGLPPSAGFVVPLIETQETRPFLFYQSPRPLSIWTVAQSRAPPPQV